MAMSPQQQTTKRPLVLADDGELTADQPVPLLTAVPGSKTKRTASSAQRRAALWPIGLAVGLPLLVFAIAFVTAARDSISAQHPEGILIGYLICFVVLLVATGRYLVQRSGLDGMTEHPPLEIILRVMLITALLMVVMVAGLVVMFLSLLFLPGDFFGLD